MALHPQVRAFLDARNQADPGIDYLRISATELRAGFAIPASPAPAGTELLRVEDRCIPTRAGDINARLYVPPACGPQPVTVFFHGGGFCIGTVETTDSLCRSLAVHSRSIVVSVDYRLAPEAPFPAGVEDAQDSMEWVARHTASFGGDATRLAVAGNSSGGNFAAVVAQWARHEQIVLRHQLLMFPVTDASRESASYAAFAEGYFLTADMMRWFRRLYLPTPSLAVDLRASPLLQTDLAGVAPATIFTAEYDVLRDEGEAYGAALRRAGVPIHCKRWDGQIHDFTLMAEHITDAETALREAGEALRLALHTK
ncbi:alpha/beta hydrolase [Xanthomonas arboricola pv. juglandis]|uniref:alpha/beta hydrolase n=1 Tax=Xanthomonas arboricola TaxID=56448 RepID=UPI0020189ECE|nr:alpha/beta hydrolase [Xanthomonas arboricola]UQP97331.1 alpha/beta hydrolase [Xanthomonas arboricola pv. juglandis]UQQ01550.1 alpha/beta hydrolase [Xanthomonas arboricola pv. juglandis]